MAPRAALLAWALLLSAAALHCCAAGGSDPVEELSSPRGIAADRIHALDGLRYSAGDYEEEEAESSTADGASYVVKPFGAEEVDFEAEELTPRSASLPPLDHSKQRYWACLHPDSPPGGASGRAQACRFKSRTAVGVKSMLERTWAPKLLGKVTENSHGSGPAFAVAPSSSRRSRGAATCENPHVRSKPLMNTGAPLRTIVFVALGGGRLCQAGTHDWRANLPRYLGKFTGAKVIIYGQTSHTCFYCHNPEGRSEGCSRDLKTHGADAVFVVGSGRVYTPQQACRPSELGAGRYWCEQQFTDLWQLLSNKWAEQARLLVHFPIRNMKRLMHNEIFDFDAIIDDGSFVKPSSPCAHEALAKCRYDKKQDALLYVARISDGKGQKAFIENVDPEMLKGYKVHFYGDGPAILKQEIAEAAKSRGIQAQVHGAVSKDTVFQALCMGKGLVMYAEDKNPRAVYEGVTAGMPVFVAREAQVATELVEQPFVTESVRRPEKGESPLSFQERFNADFADFMAQVRAEPHAQIGKWVDTSLRDETVYLNLCKRLCLCKSTRPECTAQSFTARSRIKRKPRKSAVAEPGLIHLLEDALLKDSGRPGADAVWGTVNY
eukprot:jgi/Tetstr1/455982/TSEL_042761.t1